MSRLEEFQNLKNEVSCLQEEIKKLCVLLDTAQSCLNEGEFIETKLNSNIRSLLLNVDDVQNKVKAAYIKYKLGVLPQKVGVVLKELTAVCDSLSKEKMAEKALRFMSTLKAKKGNIDHLLDADRDFLKSIDLKELKTKNELDKLDKYVELLLAFDEPDNQKRFLQIIPVLANKIEPMLLYEICAGLENFEFSIPKDIVDVVSPVNNHESVNKKEIPCEIVDDKSDNVVIEESVEKLSAESTSVEKLATSSDTVVLQNIVEKDIVKTDRPEIELETANIQGKSYYEEFVDQYTEIVDFKKSSKKETYTINKFKIQAKGCNDALYRKVFSCIDKQGYFMPEYMELSDEEKAELEEFAGRQIKLGYLQAVTIKGFGAFCVVDSVGVQALHDPNFRRIVGLGKANKRVDITRFSTYNPFNVFSFIRTREFVVNETKGSFTVEQELVDNNTFSSILFNSKDKDRNIVILGITSNRAEDVNKLKNSLAKITENSIVIIAGLDLDKSRRNKKWLLDLLPGNVRDNLSKEHVICYSCVDEKKENGFEADIEDFSAIIKFWENELNSEEIGNVNEIDDNPVDNGVQPVLESDAENKGGASNPDINPVEEEICVPKECFMDIPVLDCDISCYEDKEKKAISPKEFKRNLGSNEMCCYILRTLVVNGYVNSESIASYYNKTVEACEFNIGLLHKAGLIRKYDYSEFGSCYVLSPKGSNLCSTGSMLSFLKINGHNDVDIQTRYKEIHSSNTIAFVKTDAYISDSLNKKFYASDIGNEYFVYYVSDKQTKANGLCSFGCFSSDKQSFAKLLSSIKKVAYTNAIYLCVGWNKEQAKAVAEWAQASMVTIRENILYKAFDDNTIYHLDGDSYDVLLGAVRALSDKTQNAIENLKEKAGQVYKEGIVQQVLGDVATEVENKDAEVEDTKPISEKKKKKNIKNKTVVDIPVEEITEPELVEECSENFVLDKPSTEKYIENFVKMLKVGKTYAACAYLKVLSSKDKKFESLYKQLAYATGDPLGGCSYTSKVVSDAFYSCESFDEYLLVSATLRTFFMDYFKYDYFISEFQRMVMGSSVIEAIKPLGMLVKELGDFKCRYNVGVDHYADYHKSSNKDVETMLAELRNYTQSQFEHYIINFKEDISNKRFSEARKIFLDKNGEIAKLLRYIINGDESITAITEIKNYLKENFIKDDAAIREENIDYQKLDDVLENNWIKAAEHINYSIRSSDLMSSLRQKFSNQIERLVKPLCNYVVLTETKIPVDNQNAAIEYKKLRSKLLKYAAESIDGLKEYEDFDVFSVKVLRKTLEELIARLDGSYKLGSEKYFYLDFLKTDHILLDEQYLPYLQDVQNLPSMSALRRIEQHLSTSESSFEKRAQAILANEDNYTSLECILQYLDMVKEGYSAKFRKEKALKLSMENACKGLEFLREEFENEIELRQSYGQIDETEGNRKEKLISCINHWYEWAKETHNYGFFRKVCEAYIEHIESEALPRGIVLAKKLSDFKEKNPEKIGTELVDDAIRTIEERIRIKNFTAAEDLLNRLERDELMVVKDVIEFDYLRNFIANYDNLYQDVFNMRTSLKDVLLKRVPHNKEAKAAARIAENWIYRSEYCNQERVKYLLESLDFSVGKITVRPKIGNVYVFDVTLAKPADGRKVKYKHPIAAFGSVAESEAFRIAFVFGNFETQGLLEVFNTLGDAQDTLVFVDGALNLSVRRNLARKTKETTRKIFAVVDRVVLAYLVRFYKQAAVQNMLMNIVIPFAYCQPYNPDNDVIAPEMFIGREEELAQIESANGVNIVYGGRQLGKSAMLRMAQSHIDKNERGDRAVYVDVNKLDYAKACLKVSTELVEEDILEESQITDDWHELAHHLRVRLKSEKNRIPYLLLLLDEADKFIATSAEVGYSPLEALREVQGVGIGRFKFVFAGLRDVIRFDHNQALANNSVLTKLSKITVRPFDVNEARTLLEKPLSYLGLRFAKDKDTEALITSIFGSTNYFPGLVQLYCRNLIQAMQRPDYAGYDEVDTPPYNISVEHIKKVLGGTELQKQIREKFFITLEVGQDSDSFYYNIALLVALQHHLDVENSDVTPSMIIALANRFGTNQLAVLDEQKVYALMEELCDLNVLHNSGKGYRFTRHSFYQMMGSESHIEEELLKLMGVK